MSIEYNNLKLFRKQNGLTQEQVAEKLNVSRQAVAKWENGDSVPDLESCISLKCMAPLWICWFGAFLSVKKATMKRSISSASQR